MRMSPTVHKFCPVLALAERMSPDQGSPWSDPTQTGVGLPAESGYIVDSPSLLQHLLTFELVGHLNHVRALELESHGKWYSRNLLTAQ